ncbi:glycosyltransferase family 2 protein [Flavobacterium luteum]|uniref:Glycosyltransferase n=1 Tax=Flavobacterium luteum TaxID=2026654 RepID=A0A7J5AB37_9FLAO|nr:glycosyltransferase family 2 protein [Flavobacterium luteum]KAB1154760.1 glycosyltransferase [Flavobacterium luteum]
MQKNISVIISTYNATEWLKKVIWGYNTQTYRNFEMVIADDGSTQATSDLIEEIRKEVFFPIIHVWHEDNGFQKSQILNKSILSCNTPYILMSDGDCIPRPDFIEQHIKFREEGFFLSGGYHKLPLMLSQNITQDEIYSEKCFDLNWLKSKGMNTSFKNSKVYSKGLISFLLNLVTPTTPSWNGHNASGWKKDILDINGFDERMQYGGQDRELGERLVNFGIKPKQIRYSTVCLHLDHPRGYATPESINKNRNIRKETKEQLKKWTDFGIIKKQ